MENLTVEKLIKKLQKMKPKSIVRTDTNYYIGEVKQDRPDVVVLYLKEEKGS